MNTKRYIKLSEEDKLRLEDLYKSSLNHRERERAHSLLLSNGGEDINKLSCLFKVKRDTISSWFNVWESLKEQEKGVKEGEQRALVCLSLRDKYRSGRPEGLSEPEKKR